MAGFFTKSNTPPWVFFTVLYCTNCTRSPKHHIWSAAFWKTHEGNCRTQATFQLLLARSSHRRGSVKKIRKFHRKALVLESLFNKVAGLQAFKVCSFIKKRLQHRCFPVKFATFLRAPSLKSICERLLLISYHAKKKLALLETQYNQSWFENMWTDHQNTAIHGLWQKEFRMEPLTFEYPLNLIAQKERGETKFRKTIVVGNSYRTIY